MYIFLTLLTFESYLSDIFSFMMSNELPFDQNQTISYISLKK